MTASPGGELRDVLGRWLFERDYRERGLASPEDARWHEWVERNQEEWRQEADAVLDGPLRALLAERGTLAAQVRAVEGLLPRIEGVIEFDMAGERYDAVMSVQQVLEHLRRALGTPTTGGGE